VFKENVHGMKETITLTTPEQKRVMVLNRLEVGQLTAAEAAVLLRLSERQVRRLCAAYRKEGAGALAHGNRGRKPVQMPPAAWQQRSSARKKMRACYFLLVQQLLEQHGRPLALSHDRHGIFQQNSAATEADSLEEQLAGKQNPTQFGRLVEELEITSIAARSPQAKGRVERFFGTLQERLMVQLRLAEARTLEQANQVLTSASFALQRAVCGSSHARGQCLPSLARDAAGSRPLLLQVPPHRGCR
jgi:hypothetical protein